MVDVRSTASAICTCSLPGYQELLHPSPQVYEVKGASDTEAMFITEDLQMNLHHWLVDSVHLDAISSHTWVGKLQSLHVGDMHNIIVVTTTSIMVNRVCS